MTELVAASEKLLLGYHTVQTEDERFLDNLELPDKLLADFILCRNLFSVGMDDMGLFAAGRGFEGVLRAIARRRNILTAKGEHAAEGHLFDLIEAFAGLRFANGDRVIEKDTQSLLHYAREARNASAHPRGRKRGSAREISEIIASEAQHVWDTCKRSRFASATKAARQRRAATPVRP